ncbi:IreB family regulatory phosphoprotein [Fusibacter sp. JL216-2]|uniref:IreB family regulatory phosphoprotein n=1 Tax=Fusibacter sp. JL216-2 TaxID=3071453 RepID=UPI003D342965
MDKNMTMKFDVDQVKEDERKEVLNYVYNALKEKGYHPINQMIGYLLSGDPTYITTHNDARKIIRRVERDEILEELLKTYLESES